MLYDEYSSKLYGETFSNTYFTVSIKGFCRGLLMLMLQNQSLLCLHHVMLQKSNMVMV